MNTYDKQDLIVGIENSIALIEFRSDQLMKLSSLFLRDTV